MEFFEEKIRISSFEFHIKQSLEMFKYPAYTLRGHKSSVTTERVVYNVGSEFREKPYLISGDEDGFIIVWDLTVRRPLLSFHPHTSQVISIRQLPNGLVLTHGRDHYIKVFELFQHGKEELVYEIPVNSLNFNNIDTFEYYLITSNTMDSNSFDVYDIGFLQDESKQFTRVFNCIDLFKMVKDDGVYKFNEFKIQNEDNKFGIIMRLLWVDSNRVYIGYESGHVISVSLDLGAQSIEVLNVSNVHFPDPVLALRYDSHTNTVISSSIKPKIGIHTSTGSSVIKLSDKFGKLSDIEFLNSNIVLSSWNGFIKVFNQQFEELINFKKAKPIVSANLNTVGNMEEPKPEALKPNCLAVYAKQAVEIKGIARRRDVQLCGSNLLAIGFNDGTIMVYNDL